MSSKVASDEPEPFDISDDEDEDESAYQPTVGAKRAVSVSPHRPSALVPSSSLSHTAGGGFASSSAASTVGSRKVFDGTSRAIATGGGTSALTTDTEILTPKESDEVDIGFVPSFLETGSKPRQKRYRAVQYSTVSAAHLVRQSITGVDLPPHWISLHFAGISEAARWVTPCRGDWGEGGPCRVPWTTWTSLLG